MEINDNKKSADILLVEDNPGDVRLIQEACREIKSTHHIHVVRDGEEAMEFLKKKGEFSEAPRPNLILLDLNLPKKSGYEVLADIKEDPVLKSIPVVVLTSSDAEQDMLKTGKLNVNGYVIKSADLDQLLSTVRSLESIWLNSKKDGC